MQLTDAAISEDESLRRALEGDAAAFHALYRSNIGRVYAVCLRMSGDKHRAEELAQETFVRAWEKLGTFRQDSTFSTWIYRIAINLCLSAIRTSSRRRTDTGLVDDPGGDEGRLPEQAITCDPGTTIDLETAIRRLPDGARAIFVLHDVEGMKHEEIAESLGLAVGTCKAQLHRARTMLKEMLS